MKQSGVSLWQPGVRDMPVAALQKLHKAVHELTRAKRLQQLLGYAWAGLFWGLVAACGAVLLLRTAQPQLSSQVLLIVAGLVAGALLLAVVLAWRRRPDDLAVAILADVQLNLKQKLSTAWEFARSGSDPALSESLAVQAVQARLPARTERIFPLSINTWGRLVPVAAGLLLLLYIIDLPQLSAPEVIAADAVVLEQGAQLREYGRQMEARAERGSLPRSSGQSRHMQRLGSRMESGGLAREQALQQLRQLTADLDSQRRAALSMSTGEAGETRIDPGSLQTMTLRPGVSNPNLRSMLEDLASGRRKYPNQLFLKSVLPYLHWLDGQYL